MNAPHRPGRSLTEWPVVDYREAVRDMKPLEAVEYLLGLLDFFVAPPDQDALWSLPGCDLTLAQKRILRALVRFGLGLDGVVTRDQIMSVVYGSRSDADWPIQKVLDTQVCKMRPKLAGAGIEIVTVWGVGYSVRVPEGFVWPWEVRE